MIKAVFGLTTELTTEFCAKINIQRKKQGRKTMSERKEIIGKFRYEKDSKRYHRFNVELGKEVGIVGNLYVPKGIDAMPKKIILEYADKRR
jgi:hypothetical protein